MLSYVRASEPSGHFTLGKQNAPSGGTNTSPHPAEIRQAELDYVILIGRPDAAPNKPSQPNSTAETSPTVTRANPEPMPPMHESQYQKLPSADRATVCSKPSTSLSKPIQFEPVALPQLHDGVSLYRDVSSRVRVTCEAINPNGLQ